MAGNNPFGLRPVCSMRGGNWTDSVREYYISSTTANGATTGYATSVFTGDPVVFNRLQTAATIRDTIGTIARYTPGYADAAPSTFGDTPVVGVFMGCEYYDANVNSVNNPVRSKHWPWPPANLWLACLSCPWQAPPKALKTISSASGLGS